MDLTVTNIPFEEATAPAASDFDAAPFIIEIRDYLGQSYKPMTQWGDLVFYLNEKGQELSLMDYGENNDFLIAYFTGVKSGERNWPARMVTYSTAGKARIEAAYTQDPAAFPTKPPKAATSIQALFRGHTCHQILCTTRVSKIQAAAN